MTETKRSRVRLRHYTRKSSRKRILAEGILRARDQNKVFVERADRKPLSSREAEDQYLIDRGRGNAFIEFDADWQEVHQRQSPLTGEIEWTLIGAMSICRHATPRVSIISEELRMATPKTIKVCKQDLLHAWMILEDLAVSFGSIGRAFSIPVDLPNGDWDEPENEQALREALVAYLTPQRVKAINAARMKLGRYLPDKECETLSEETISYWNYAGLKRTKVRKVSNGKAKVR